LTVIVLPLIFRLVLTVLSPVVACAPQWRCALLGQASDNAGTKSNLGKPRVAVRH
jgi:hypothetical protein